MLPRRVWGSIDSLGPDGSRPGACLSLDAGHDEGRGADQFLMVFCCRES